MRLFVLNRTVDASGISGTGIVAEGVQFSDGRCVIVWLTEHKSIGIYENIKEIEAIHGHNGCTTIQFI